MASGGPVAGWELRDPRQGRCGGFPTAAQHHGGAGLQRGRAEQHLPHPLLRPPPGQRLLRKIRGTSPSPKLPSFGPVWGAEEGTVASPPVPQTDCQEIATVVSATEIRTVAELLQISPEGLQKAITFKVTVSARGGRRGTPPVRAVPDPSGSRTTAVVAESSATPMASCATNQETLREKIFTPLTVESAVDAR